VVAGAFLNALQGWSVSVLGLVVSGFPLLFMISFLLRTLVTFTLIPRIRLSGAIAEEDRPFLLPMFFESVPGISRLVRQQRQASLLPRLPAPDTAVETGQSAPVGQRPSPTGRRPSAPRRGPSSPRKGPGSPRKGPGSPRPR